jgi:hypothetical protein
MTQLSELDMHPPHVLHVVKVSYPFACSSSTGIVVVQC